MNEQEHRIFRLAFDLSMPEDEMPGPIQDRISRLLHLELNRLLYQTFSDFVSVEEFIAIERLELDLGRIRIDELEQDLPIALLKELRTQLGRLLQRKDYSSSGFRRKKVASGQTLIFLELLVRGAYPWWVSENEKKSPSELLNQLIAMEEGTLPEILYRVIRQEFPRRRTVQVFSDQELKHIVRILQPEAFPFMDEWPDRLAEKQQKTPVLSVDAANFRTIHWELILQQIAEQRGSTFNQKAFTQNILEGLAKAHNTSYEKLLFQLLQASEAVKQRAAPSFQLISILQELAKTAKQQNKTSDFTSNSWQGKLLTSVPTSQKMTAHHLLKRLSAPKQPIPDFNTIGKERWTLLIQQLWEIDESAAIEMIGQLAKSGQSGIAYLRHVPRELLQQILASDHIASDHPHLSIFDDFLTMGAHGSFPSISKLALQEALIGHLLSAVIVPNTKAHDILSVWQSLLFQLVGDTAQNLQKWLLATLMQLPPLSDQLKISRYTIEVLEALAIRYGVHFDVQQQNWQISSRLASSTDITPPTASAVTSTNKSTSTAEHASPAEEIFQTDSSSPLQSSQREQEFKVLTEHINRVREFIKNQQLATGVSLHMIEESWMIWARQSPQSLTKWLQHQQNNDGWSRLLSTNFSSELSSILFRLILPSSDHILPQIEKWLATSDYWQHTGKGEHSTYRELLWTSWQEIGSPVFTLREFLITFLKKIDPSFINNQLQQVKQPEVTWALHLFQSSILPKDHRQASAEDLLLSADLSLMLVRLQQQLEHQGAKAVVDLIFQWMLVHPYHTQLKLWLGIMQTPTLQVAVAEQLQEADLLTIGRQLNPTLTETVIDLLATVQAVRQQLKLPLKTAMAPQLTTLILGGLLHQRGSVANQKSFLLKLIQLWAARNQVSFTQTLETIQILLPEIAPMFHNWGTIQLLQTLIYEQLTTVPDTAITSTKKEPAVVQPEQAYRKLWEKENTPLVFQEIWPINNAGLVLLWPYMAALFERLDWLRDGVFTDENCQQKAALLLDYIVWGKVPDQEYELVLNKVLCAIPLERPISAQLPIDSDTVVLIESLLEAVIAYWSVLDNISTSAFRETFLQRDGHLGLTDQGWVLQVNQRSYDVLLSQLPWGISTVNLSWLDSPISVEWT